MLDARELLNAAVDYIRKNPDELVKAAVNAAGLRFGVPIAARGGYLSTQAKLPKKAPKDIDIGSAPPALRIGLSVDAIGDARARERGHQNRRDRLLARGPCASDVETERREARPPRREQMFRWQRSSYRGTLESVEAGKPGEAAPSSRGAIVEADGGSRSSINLMKVPAVADNARLRKLLAIVTPVVNVRAVETDRDHIYVALKASPRGLPRLSPLFAEGFRPDRPTARCKRPCKRAVRPPGRAFPPRSDAPAFMPGVASRRAIPGIGFRTAMTSGRTSAGGVHPD